MIRHLSKPRRAAGCSSCTAIAAGVQRMVLIGTVIYLRHASGAGSRLGRNPSLLHSVLLAR